MKKTYNFIKKKVRSYPLVTFFAMLGLLLVVILAGNSLRQPQETTDESKSLAKKTEVYNFGDTPYLSLSAEVDKGNVITINATTSGVVSRINVKEGQKISPGTRIVSITDTYNGANISAIDRRIAQKTKEIQDITYEKNEDILDFQRDEVPRTDSEANGIARKQVTVQKRELDLNKETIDLNLEKARIADALHYPSAPYWGTVEKIHINSGDFIQAGQPLVSFAGSKAYGTAEVLVSLQIAKMISVQDNSYLHLGTEKIPANPIYISKEATDGQQYSVLYSIPVEYLSSLANSSFVKVEIPLDNDGDGEFSPMVPIDAVQLTQDKAYVFILKDDNTAESREIELGSVFGQFVQVLDGISIDEEVILNRNVFHGDKVEKI